MSCLFVLSVFVFVVLSPLGAAVAAAPQLTDLSVLAPFTPESPEWVNAVELVDSEHLLVATRNEVPAQGGRGVVRAYAWQAGAWQLVDTVLPGVPAHEFGQPLRGAFDRFATTATPVGGGGRRLYIFHFDDAQWLEDAVIDDSMVPCIAEFPMSYDFSGDELAVSCQASPPQPGAPAVYLFRRTQGQWLPAGTLLAPDGDPGQIQGQAQGLGAETALSPDLLLVGDPDAFGPNFESGGVLAYRRVEGVWGEGVWHWPNTQEYGIRYGSYLEIVGGLAMVAGGDFSANFADFYSLSDTGMDYLNSVPFVSPVDQSAGQLYSAAFDGEHLFLLGSLTGGQPEPVIAAYRFDAGEWSEAGLSEGLWEPLTTVVGRLRAAGGRIAFPHSSPNSGSSSSVVTMRIGLGEALAPASGLLGLVALGLGMFGLARRRMG